MTTFELWVLVFLFLIVSALARIGNWLRELVTVLKDKSEK